MKLNEFALMDKNQTDTLISPCIDVVFKAILGVERNKNLLESLVSSILNIPREDLVVTKILNPELPVNRHDGKASRLDLRAELRDGTDLDIEIQVNPMDAFNERSLFYWSKIYSENLNRGGLYRELKKCIVINILSFKHFQHDTMHTCFHIQEDETHMRLTDHLEIHYIELPKIKSYNRDKESPRLIEWMEFLRIKDGENVTAIKEREWSDEIKMALEELKELSKNPDMREEALSREIALRDYYQRLYEAEVKGRENGLAQGIEEGKEIGKEIGIEEGILKVAKEMKTQGAGFDLIKKCTGLTDQEIEAL